MMVMCVNCTCLSFAENTECAKKCYALLSSVEALQILHCFYKVAIKMKSSNQYCLNNKHNCFFVFLALYLEGGITNQLFSMN